MVTTPQVLLSGLAGLASLRGSSPSAFAVAASTGTDTASNGTIISDTYFYGQSPPVYPSRMSFFIDI
ncbi:MAG: hypothetical protein ACRERD_29850 [Candidatus Binatia bacterium]